MVRLRFAKELSDKLSGKTFEFGSDMDWITSQIAVGGQVDGIGMADLRRQGVTHVLNVGGVDDTELAASYGIQSFWNPVADDFAPKCPDWFERGVNFARHVLKDGNAKLYIHCAQGIHRGPLATLAVLVSRGWTIEDARRHIERCRPVANFPDVYVDSVRGWAEGNPVSRESLCGLAALAGGRELLSGRFVASRQLTSGPSSLYGAAGSLAADNSMHGERRGTGATAEDGGLVNFAQVFHSSESV